MAQKRMFDKDITSKDSFTEMSSDAQSLYFHLGLHADDEGFISPKGIMRMISASEDSLKLLIVKKFVIPFESGVVVITDWKQNNWLDDRRVKPTQYQEEVKLLTLTDNKKYELSNGLASIVQSSTVQNRIEEKKRENKFSPPSLDDVKSYCLIRKNNVDAENFINFYESKGWLIGKNKMKDWQAAVRTWENRDRKVDNNNEIKIPEYAKKYIK